MKIENDYPKIEKKINNFFKIRKIFIILFIISFIITFIINLLTGGKLWSMYVLFGEIIFYYALLNKPHIDNKLIKKISFLLFIIGCYLYVIDKINNTSWSYIVINILSFSLLIIQLFLFFIDYEYHKNKVIIVLFTSIFSCFFCLFAILNIISINWAVIVTGSIGLFNLILLFTFYFKTTILEIKKYFSLK